MICLFYYYSMPRLGKKHDTFFCPLTLMHFLHLFRPLGSIPRHIMKAVVFRGARRIYRSTIWLETSLQKSASKNLDSSKLAHDYGTKHRGHIVSVRTFYFLLHLLGLCSRRYYYQLCCHWLTVASFEFRFLHCIGHVLPLWRIRLYVLLLIFGGKWIFIPPQTLSIAPKRSYFYGH